MTATRYLQLSNVNASQKCLMSGQPTDRRALDVDDKK